MDLKEQIRLEYIKKFDTVLAHTFAMYKSQQKGAELPPFMERELYEQAKQYTMNLHRSGLLVGFYDRLQKGAL